MLRQAPVIVYLLARVKSSDGKVFEAKMSADSIAVMQACLSGAKFVRPEDKSEGTATAEQGFAAMQSAIGYSQ